MRGNDSLQKKYHGTFTRKPDVPLVIELHKHVLKMQKLRKQLHRAANRIKCSRFAQKSVLAAIAITVSVSEAMAGSKGAAGFTKATQEVSSYQEPVSNLMKAIAAVIVLVGAFNVYFKMQNGDQDVKKKIMMVVGACIFLVAAAQALPLFFGL